MEQNTALPEKDTIKAMFFFIQKKTAKREHCREKNARNFTVLYTKKAYAKAMGTTFPESFQEYETEKNV